MTPQEFAQAQEETAQRVADSLKESAFLLNRVTELLPQDKEQPFWKLQQAINEIKGGNNNTQTTLATIKKRWKGFGNNPQKCSRETKLITEMVLQMRHAVLPYTHKNLGIAFLLFMLLFGLWKGDVSYAQEEKSPDLTKHLFIDLNTFWNSTVGKTKPNAGWFKALVLPQFALYTSLSPTHPSEPTTSKQPTPPQNIILGTVNSGSTSQDNRLGFFVIPVSKNHRQELYQRLAAYEMYLNLYAAFDANSEATCRRTYVAPQTRKISWDRNVPLLPPSVFFRTDIWQRNAYE